MLEGRRLIGVHVEDGIVQRVTSDNVELANSTVVVYNDGKPARALFASMDDEGQLNTDAIAALNSARCHGIGIACDLAGEKLIELGRTKYTNPKEFISQVAGVLSVLSDMVGASMRLELPEDE